MQRQYFYIFLDSNLGRIGTFHLPASCDPSKLGECLYILMWFHTVHSEVEFVIFSKEVDEMAIGFSSIKDQNFVMWTLATTIF